MFATLTSAALLLCLTPGEKPDLWADTVVPFVEQHCLACHDAAEAAAEVVLEGDISVLDGAAEDGLRTWKQALLRIEDGSMPPRQRLRPTEEEVRGVAHALRTLIAEREPTPARAPVLRRLTRREWRASVESLFGVEAPEAELFPEDDVAAGFDSNGAVLTTTDVHVEKQLLAAEAIAARVVQDLDAPVPPRRRVQGKEGPKAAAHAPRAETRVVFSNGAWGFEHVLPRAGEYRVRVRWRGDQAGPEVVRAELRVGGRSLSATSVDGEEWHEHEWQGALSAGRQRIAAAFLNDYFQKAEPASEARPAVPQADRNLVVAWLELEGPLDPQVLGTWQRRNVPGQGVPDLESVVRTLLREVWRRPPTAHEVERLCALADPQATRESNVRLVLVAALASPHFLYKVEQAAEPGASRELDAHERAMRLSYYLTGQPPDERLRAAADSGALLDTAEHMRQAQRLLDSSAALAALDDFAEQWLGLRSLRYHRPDPAKYPDYDEALASDLRAETLALVRQVYESGASARSLLESPRTYLTARLAAHYGVAVPAGAEGAWLHEWSDSARYGLLGHAAVLTLTSRPGRTSPVLRGKWVLETLLGTPPPPPPPGVGALEESATASATTLRAQLEQHRADAACSACHEALDPLGFGLERYDAVGRMRATDEGFPVDDSGLLPDGRSFRGAAELRTVLLSDDRLERALFEKLFVYALGRLPESEDRSEMGAYLAALGPRPSLRALMLGITQLPGFTRRVERGAPPVPVK